MSESNLPSTTTQTSKTQMVETLPSNKREATRWARARLAHEALMLEDTQALLRQSRELTRAHARAMGLEVPEQEDDEMIHIGDLYQQTPATQDSATINASGTLSSTVSSLLKKAAIVVALLATGGLGASAAWLADQISQIAQQKNASQENISENETVVDHDTLFELRLHPSETTSEPQ